MAAFTVLSTTPAYAQLRAFGDAEGYGSVATGGRAATSVYHVTNLNDSGAGSLRDAVSASNRIVVFDVGGEIKLSTGISAQGNITIAGQTAPGAGITITGAQAIGFTNRSNVIMRYVRMRPGDTSSASDNGMSMTDTGTAILDHVSIEFGKYNNIDAVSGNQPHITIQHSIIADPISTGTSTRGQGFGAHLEAVNGYYTLSNNLWANSHSRNPLAKVNEQFKNNVEYNNEIGYLTSGTSTQFDHDLVNNSFIDGPNYTGSSDYGQLSTPDKYYAVGNVADTNRNGLFVKTDGTIDGAISNPVLSTDSRYSATPLHPTTLSLPTLSVIDAYAYVLAHAGSSLSRDQLDQLVIGQVQTLGLGTTGYTAGTTGPDNTTVPFDTVHDGLYWKAYLTGLDNGGLGTTASASRAANFDADKDGVADAWELTHGMNPVDATDAFKKNPLGYLMVEQYINELGDQNPTAAWVGTAAAPGPYTHAVVRGTGAANGSLTINTTPAVAVATQVMSLSIGGNGPATGEVVNVVSGGRLNVYDTITVGEFGNAALNVSGTGYVSALNIQLGNTDYSSGTGVTTAGTINFSGGTLNVASLVRGAGSPGNWNAGGSMNWTGGTLLAAGALSVNVPIAVGTGGGSVNTNGIDGTISSVVSDLPGSTGGLLKLGTGTLTLSGASTFTGAVTIQTDTVAVTSLSNSGIAGPLGAGTDASDLVFNGGTLRAAAAATISTDRLFTLTRFGGVVDGGTAGIQFTGTGNVAFTGNGNRTLLLTGTSNNSAFYSGLGDGPGGVTSVTLNATTTAGRWLFNASATPRTYSGDTTITQGTLLTLANNLLPSGLGRGNLVVTAGTFEMNNTNQAINGLSGAGFVNQRGTGARTLTLGNGNATAAFSGILSNSGTTGGLSVVKVGTGTQTFSGANTYGGSTTIQGGALKATAAAYAGLLTNAGGINVQTGKFIFDYTGGTSPLSQVKALLTTGYAAGFATGQLRSTTATTARGLGYADSGTTVTVQAALYGDANLDGQVDFNDFIALQTNYLSPGTTWSQGNFNYDNITDFNDFISIQTNYGQSLTGANVSFTTEQTGIMNAFFAAKTTEVPEPAALAAFGACAAGLLRRSRRLRAELNAC